MTYYFYNQHDDYRAYDDFQTCRQAARRDGSVRKIRDNRGGEYYLS